MEKVLILLLLAFVLADTFDFGQFFGKNLKNGKSCRKSEQCASGCCLKEDFRVKMPSCAEKAAEDEPCSNEPTVKISKWVKVYSKCPCGSDLTCGTEKTCEVSER